MNYDTEEGYSFEWDEGNTNKILARFKTLKEIEELFKGKMKIYLDERHTKNEIRILGYTKNKNNRPVYVCFTLRNNKVRVISARYMHLKESLKYEEEN